MVVKSLRNRVRGWFPQEPYMISTRVKVKLETKQSPPLIIPPQYKVSATKVAGAFAVFWIIFYGFILFTILDLETYPISAFQIVAWIIVGIAVGTISSMYLIKNQLKRLSKEYQLIPNGKDLVIATAPILLFFLIGSFIIYSVQGPSIGLSTLGGLLISLYSWGISIQITRFVLFVAFEKKENMRLMQGWLEGKIILIPKPPEGQLNMRGELLNFFLVAGIVGCVLATLGYVAIDLVLLTNSTGLGDILSKLSVPLWTLTFYPILAIVNACTLVALYRWRKWGFYVLLTSSLVAFTMNVAILGLKFEFIAGLLGIVLIYILLRPKWSMLESGWPHMRKSLSLVLAILGIILLISSFALTSHVEDRLISVPQTKDIANDGFYSNQTVPDAEIQANLTTQERLHFQIMIARYYPHMSNGSSVKFTISNQSLSSDKPTNIYFSNDKIGLPNDYYMYWSAPENGTYYFTLNYNLSAGNFISYDISKVSHIEEPIQVLVFTPLLPQYLMPILILTSAALLVTGIAIPIRNILLKKSPQFDKA